MYLNGMGFRAIARVTAIDPTTIINWVRERGETLPDEIKEEEIPEITEIDELQTFVGSPKNQFWIWTLLNYHQSGILLWTVGVRSRGGGAYLALIKLLSGFGRLFSAGIVFGM
jgi:hypothetical protein